MNFLAPLDSSDRFNSRAYGGTGSRSMGIRYPSPFFDVAQQYLPDNVHQLHLWCRYYFLTNPIINVAITKMAEYPVTRLIFETDDVAKKKLYVDLEEQLGLRQFEVEVGLDHFCYGNAFVSIHYPFVKYLVCTGCKERYRAEKNRSLYRWRNMRFHLTCPKCRHEGPAEERDIYIRSIRDIRLLRWNPENIDIKHNEVTGLSKYYYRLPRPVINDITLGDPDTIEQLPIEFLDAARRGKPLLFSKDNFFHLKRPTIAQKDQGWGTPLIYPLLKDAFYLSLLKKAQEAICMDHIVPLRMIFPGPSTGGNDSPYGSYNLSNWKSKIEAEVNLWKRDPNHIPILPVNMGFQQFGGDARALMLHSEIRLVAEQMLAGAGIPVEFVFGGLSWSGSNTSLRALENMFLGYNRQRHTLINDFILGNIAAYMQWPKVNSRFDRFKMADDLQRAMFYLQLSQAQKISDKRLHEELGEDTENELQRMQEELKTQLAVQRKMQTAAADVQGEAQLRTSRYATKAQSLQMRAQAEQQLELQQLQAQNGQQQQPMKNPGEGGPPPPPPQQPMSPEQAQQLPQQALPAEPLPANAAAPDDGAQVPGMPQGSTAYQENGAQVGKVPAAMGQLASPLTPQAGGMDLRYLARRAAAYLRTVGEEQGEASQQQELQRMKLENPPLYQLVLQLLEGDKGSQVDPLNGQRAALPAGGSERGMGRQIG